MGNYVVSSVEIEDCFFFFFWRLRIYRVLDWFYHFINGGSWRLKRRKMAEVGPCFHRLTRGEGKSEDMLKTKLPVKNVFRLTW